ncbi:MAG: hypothetical protein ACXWLC_11560 [Rhizomicrobium sp.]
MTKQPKPKRIVMLAFEDAQILDITGRSQIVGAANRGRAKPFYEIVLAARVRFQIDGETR